jgi:hypothetical protein
VANDAQISAQSVSNILNDIATTYGPQATEAILFVYRLEAMKYLAICIVFLAASIFMFKFGRDILSNAKSARKKLAEIEGQGTVEQQTEIKSLKTDASCSDLGVALSIASAVLAVISIFFLISPYYWMAAFGSPQALMAKKALTAAGML